MWQAWTVLLRHLAASLRACLESLPYPPPRSVELYPGEPGSIDHFIVLRVASRDDAHVQLLPFPDAEHIRVPQVFVDDEIEGTTGTLGICRYLGRVSNIHPSTPDGALEVDSSLEVLHGLLLDGAHVRQGVKWYMSYLEARLQRYEWVASHDASLADYCWLGAIEWMRHQNLITEDLGEFPHLESWCTSMISEKKRPRAIKKKRMSEFEMCILAACSILPYFAIHMWMRGGGCEFYSS